MCTGGWRIHLNLMIMNLVRMTDHTNCDNLSASLIKIQLGHDVHVYARL